MTPNLASMTKQELIAKIKKLEVKLRASQSSVKKLRERKGFADVANLLNGSSIGWKAELFVAHNLNLDLTQRNAPHDLVTQSGDKIEIKGSNCNPTGPNGEYRRWNWHNFLGCGEKDKEYDFLILVGETDSAHSGEYLDADSPYVIFDLPFSWAEEVARELRRTKEQRRFQFGLMTTPRGHTSDRCRGIWKYETTLKKLVAKYRKA